MKNKKLWNYDWIDFHLYAEHIDDFQSDLEMELSSIPNDVHCPDRKKHLRKQINEVKELKEEGCMWIDNSHINQIIGYTDDEYIEKYYPFCLTFYEEEVCEYDVDIVFENTATFKDLFDDISETYKNQNQPLKTPDEFVDAWLRAGENAGTWDWDIKEAD